MDYAEQTQHGTETLRKESFADSQSTAFIAGVCVEYFESGPAITPIWQIPVGNRDQIEPRNRLSCVFSMASLDLRVKSGKHNWYNGMPKNIPKRKCLAVSMSLIAIFTLLQKV
jgi:hypothetical protein